MSFIAKTLQFLGNSQCLKPSHFIPIQGYQDLQLITPIYSLIAYVSSNFPTQQPPIANHIQAPATRQIANLGFTSVDSSRQVEKQTSLH